MGGNWDRVTEPDEGEQGWGVSHLGTEDIHTAVTLQGCESWGKESKHA